MLPYRHRRPFGGALRLDALAVAPLAHGLLGLGGHHDNSTSTKKQVLVRVLRGCRVQAPGPTTIALTRADVYEIVAASGVARQQAAAVLSSGAQPPAQSPIHTASQWSRRTVFQGQAHLGIDCKTTWKG